MSIAGRIYRRAITNIITFVFHVDVCRVSDFKIHNKAMNQSQYDRLRASFTTYNTWRIAGFVAGDNESQSHLMTMLSVHVEIFSTMPPPDLSCPTCVQDMMKRLYEQTNYSVFEKKPINGNKRLKRDSK
jgi:hypothetical protein